MDADGAPVAEAGDCIRRFTLMLDAEGAVVLTYKRTMVDNRTLPRPKVVSARPPPHGQFTNFDTAAQIGETFDGGVVQDVTEMSKSPSGLRVWHVPVVYPDGSTKVCMVPLQGIKIFAEPPPPLDAIPPIA